MGCVQLLFKTLTRMLKYSIGGTDSALFTGSITYTYAYSHILYIFIDLINLNYIAPSPPPRLQKEVGVSTNPSRTVRLPFWQPLLVSLTPVRPPGSGDKK
jgi:hypothetical protein